MQRLADKQVKHTLETKDIPCHGMAAKHKIWKFENYRRMNGEQVKQTNLCQEHTHGMADEPKTHPENL